MSKHRIALSLSVLSAITRNKYERAQHPSTDTANMLNAKDISDLDNKVIINCGGVRHETYKVLL